MATKGQQTVVNAAGRVIPTFIEGYGAVRPFAGAYALRDTAPTFTPYAPTKTFVQPQDPSKLVGSLAEALKMCGIADGQCVSFHHHLRDGDGVVMQTVKAAQSLGAKELTLAPTALFESHGVLAEYVRNGVVRSIVGSLNGAIGRLASEGGLPSPAVLRSHGGRVRAVMQGDLKIDIAVIAAPCADSYGNCNGVLGKSACGPLAYSAIDAKFARKVIVVTDNLVEYPCTPISIASTCVDYVVVVPSIGDPKKIVSGTTRIADTDEALESSRLAALVAYRGGYVKNGFALQAGAGGSSLTSVKFLSEIMEREKVVAGWANGGTTSILVEMLRKGLVKKLTTCQAFDIPAVESLRDDVKTHCETDIDQYANPLNKGCVCNLLDIVVLGATEVDVHFNCNVNTHADGYLLHGIGGHQDTAAGAKLVIITCPVARGINPIVVDDVVSVTTPGECIHVIVTDEGVAINPRRKDLIEKLAPYKDELKLKTIEELRDIGYRKAGRPAKLPKTTDRIIGVIEWRDGTVIDVVHEPVHRPKDLRCDCVVKIEKNDGDAVYNAKTFSYDSNPFVTESEASSLFMDVMNHFAPHLANARQSVSATIEDASSLRWVMAARIELALRQTFPELASAPAFVLPLGKGVPGITDMAPDKFQHLRRSQLYVPGRDPYMMSKAGQNGEDGCIYDLEDAVAPLFKASARILVRNALRALDFGAAERLVRINQGAEGVKDLEQILPYAQVDGLLVPKVDCPEDIHAIEREICRIRGCEKSNIPLFPLIETAIAVEKCFEIVSASPNVTAVCMGLEDYTADCGIVKTRGGDESRFAVRRLANAAHAAKIQAIDTVFGDFGDIQGMRDSIAFSKSLGYIGKRCIHPKQIVLCNQGYSPSAVEIAKAQAVVTAFKKAGASGVVSLGNKMVDKPVVLRALKLVTDAIKCGVLNADWETPVPLTPTHK
eukprot:TRINITY_DN1049_c0_g2_i1.p1 TRINITY_DN1049_c0_g2~~TRINITY_DN1049_c0_g2_i1.p1  ORF type:complete len:944 (+),score=290.27 TRINITY_DN1049_c0_g2_i1:154-2985(+)